MNKKTIYAIIAAIILAGVVVTAIWGFNVDLYYSNNKQLDIYIGKEFENKDIKEIAKEVLGNEKILIQKVELYKDMVSITAKDITDEQVEQIVTKINEKYETENTVDDVEITENPNVKLSDIIRPYYVPIIISVVSILIYTVVRFWKTNPKKAIVTVLVTNILVQLIYFSVISITRIPFNRLTIPIALILGLGTLFVLFNNIENKLKKEK